MSAAPRERFLRELGHLGRLQDVLSHDAHLPIRLQYPRTSIDYRQFQLDLAGVPSLVSDGANAKRADRFSLDIHVPAGYPWEDKPNIRFSSPIPFHPYVFASG